MSRAVLRAVPTQAKAAIKILAEAELIAVAVPCVCELVWVLRKVYGVQTPEIATAIRALHATAKVEMNRPAVEAGLAILDAGGDFADGAIAYEGNWLGGARFVSFDKTAIDLLTAHGQSARLS